MKHIFFFSLWIAATMFSVSAQVSSKVDLHLYRQLQEPNLTGNVSLLVKGDAQKIKTLTEQYGGHYKYSAGSVSSVVIPKQNVLAFSKNSAVEKIENTFAKGRMLMDTSRMRNNVDSIHAGFAPLVSSLKGTGVVLGVIDTKVDFDHADFRKADGSTRFRYIWDQTVSGSNPPLPYSYGKQWSWIDINSGNCTHTSDSAFGHATCVTGIAAGNGLSVAGTQHEGMVTGIAPEADIVFVNVNEADEDYLVHIADAVDYIFKKADALGKPCVINTSTGTYYGSHDGNDLTTQIIEHLLTERNGRCLVAAGGNGGNIPHHLSYNIPADSAYTFFKSASPEVYFDFWADTANFKQAQFTVGCNDTLGNNLGQLRYFTVPADFNPAPGSTVYLTQNLYSNTNSLGQVNMAVTLDDNRYQVEFLIYSNNISNYWRLQTTGSGKFDLWASSALIGTADITSYIKTGNVSNPEIFIQYPNYRHPDSLKTIVSSWQCSDKVITVANYSNRAGYLDRDSVYQDMTIPPFNETVGKRFVTSSLGPTRDGRLKPDIAATGSTTICTGDAGYVYNLSFNALNRRKTSITLKHVRNGGTSMASPVVAGIAALYLQKKPTATYDEIKEAIICTAKRDNFTGNQPNNEYGHGKVNGFAALTRSAGCFVFGAKDTACINYNALANVDSGGCVEKVYGCTDSTADNYNPLANISTGICFFTSVKNLGDENLKVTVAPNPFSGETTFMVEGLSTAKASLRFINLLGEQVDEVKLNQPVFVYRNSKLAKGVYQFVLTAESKKLSTGKLVVE